MQRLTRKRVDDQLRKGTNQEAAERVQGGLALLEYHRATLGIGQMQNCSSLKNGMNHMIFAVYLVFFGKGINL